MSEDKQYDFYVAGPFFDPEQTASMERLEKILEDHGKVLFKPRFVSQIEEVGPEGCFADDIHGINAAKAVVANLMDEDRARCSKSDMRMRWESRCTAISKTLRQWIVSI